MAYYRDNRGRIAKVLITVSKVAVMFDWSTFFFDSMESANSYLLAQGYYR